MQRLGAAQAWPGSSAGAFQDLQLGGCGEPFISVSCRDGKSACMSPWIGLWISSSQKTLFNSYRFEPQPILLKLPAQRVAISKPHSTASAAADKYSTFAGYLRDACIFSCIRNVRYTGGVSRSSTQSTIEMRFVNGGDSVLDVLRQLSGADYSRRKAAERSNDWKR